MVSILLELLPYMILSMTREVPTVVMRPYSTASTEPNTGQPSRMMTRSMRPVKAPTDRWGRSILMDMVRKSVPPLEVPRIYIKASDPPRVMPAKMAASRGSPV